MPFLEVSNVDKGFGVGKRHSRILHNINLSIEEGEFVAIIGCSGSGKTTLMSLLAGLSRPDVGRITLAGAEIAGPGPDRGMVFQNYSLLPWMSVYANVALAVDQVFGGWTPERRRHQTEKYIKMVNLEAASAKLPRELSGGMRQRVSLARTLALQPRVMLLDEPLGALDALTRGILQEELSRICQEEGKTVLLITNDPDEALLLADRVIPLAPGPDATLLESIPVTLARPRNRRALLQDPTFKSLRNEIIDRLMEAKKRPVTDLTRTLVLPDIEPEDISLTTSRFLFGMPRKAKRPHERQAVKVEVEA